MTLYKITTYVFIKKTFFFIYIYIYIWPYRDPPSSRGRHADLIMQDALMVIIRDALKMVVSLERCHKKGGTWKTYGRHTP